MFSDHDVSVPVSNSLTVFKFDSLTVRVVSDSKGDPWFVARDVAICLGYEDPKGAILRHCKKAKSLIDIGELKQHPYEIQFLDTVKTLSH